jgi:molybdenum storage protein
VSEEDKMNSEPSFVTKDVASVFARQTLLDRDLVRQPERPVVRLLPWLNVVTLGGRSIIDRGAETILPIVEVLRGAMAMHRLLILTGPGVRARHVLGVGLDLGLPTGVLAAMMSTEAEQNGRMIASLLAADGVSYLSHTTVAHQLAVHLAASPAAVSNGFAPYGVYEFPPAAGKIPPHRTDAGAFLLADAYGAARTIYVKDVDGVYTRDPALAEGEKPELLARVSAAELTERGIETLPIDSIVLDLMATAKHVKEIQVVNGLDPANITAALAGEHVGTIIHA